MFGNLALIVFCILIAWLLYRFPLQKAKTPADYRKLFPFFCALLGFLLFNGFLAYLGQGGLSIASSSTPVQDLKSLAEIKNGDGVILSGLVSDKNAVIYGGYVAYLDNHLWSPMELWLDLKDGSIPITNGTYQATNWPVDTSGISYLQAKQQVIVVGFVEDGTGPTNGNKSRMIRADIVYAGTHDKFTARARSKLILATAMVWSNAFVALMIIILPLRDCLKGMKDGLVSSK
jgi:hypothetical protein